MIRLSDNTERRIREKMASGKYGSEDELLGSALDSLDADSEDLSAIAAALDSVDQGVEGTPLDEAFAKLRAKHQIDEE